MYTDTKKAMTRDRKFSGGRVRREFTSGHQRKNFKYTGKYEHGIEKGQGRGGISKKNYMNRASVLHEYLDQRNVFSPQTIQKNNVQTQLILSDLDVGVNDGDIQLLFGEFGNLRRVAVHYDRLGRPLGTAQVIFNKQPDAINAMREYNGARLLNGRPITVELTTSKINPEIIKSGDEVFQKKFHMERTRSVKGTSRPAHDIRNKRPLLEGKRRSNKEGRRKQVPGVCDDNKFQNNGLKHSKNRFTKGRQNLASGVNGDKRKFQDRSPLLRDDRVNKGYGRRQNQKKIPTATELDAELDAYFAEIDSI